MAAFVTALEAGNLPPFEAGTPQQARALTKALRAARPGVAVRHITDHVAPALHGDIPIRLYCDGEAPSAVILYFHGGGWVLGSIEDSDLFVRSLVIATGCAVASVDYRLAPEHPFPAAIEDARGALDWLAANMDMLFGQRLPIFVVGDSAGGNLAATLAWQTVQRGGPSIAGQILVNPVTDCGMATRSYREFADGPLLTASLMRWFWDHYIPRPELRGDPAASPLRSDASGLPPSFVLTAECDPLRDEGEAYAARLIAAGIPVTARRYLGQIHGFVSLNISDGAAEALDDIRRFVTKSGL